MSFTVNAASVTWNFLASDPNAVGSFDYDASLNSHSNVDFDTSTWGGTHRSVDGPSNSNQLILLTPPNSYNNVYISFDTPLLAGWSGHDRV
jgi:hypothetical protein